jgi:hypothetical protein
MIESKITEKWIEEKAVELHNYLYYETFNLDQVRGFIRLLIKEIEKATGENKDGKLVLLKSGRIDKT